MISVESLGVAAVPLERLHDPLHCEQLASIVRVDRVRLDWAHDLQVNESSSPDVEGVDRKVEVTSKFILGRRIGSSGYGRPCWFARINHRAKVDELHPWDGVTSFGRLRGPCEYDVSRFEVVVDLVHGRQCFNTLEDLLHDHARLIDVQLLLLHSLCQPLVQAFTTMLHDNVEGRSVVNREFVSLRVLFKTGRNRAGPWQAHLLGRVDH
mmetsp:Transcript_23287/g.66227  ORF Transcript_23287/g.66227 Transcript_23287/m.66227 type:complete len:209 (+) Transcript_23287:349-975(+)